MLEATCKRYSLMSHRVLRSLSNQVPGGDLCELRALDIAGPSRQL